MPTDEQRHRTTMRCPVCFSREIDVLLRHLDDRYYCGKCSYEGDREDILSSYGDLKRKYRWMRKRLTLCELDAL